MDPILQLAEEEGDSDGDDDLSDSGSSSSRRRRFGKFTDADLDKLLLDLNELEKVMPAFPEGGGEGSTNLVESVLAINDQLNLYNANINESLPPPQTQSCFARTSQVLLHGFDAFETTMLPPPTPTSSTTLCTQHGVTAANHSSTEYEQQALAREIEESLVMIEEMADHEHDDHQGSGTKSFALGNCNDPTENVQSVAGGSGNGIRPFSEQAYNYGNGICDGNGLGLEGNYIHGVPSITFFGGPSPSVRYFICSQNSDGGGTEKVKGRRKKRRYRGVIETQEETARRAERTKIKNREAAAKAHEKKQVYQANLQNQILKLRKKNKFLKNMTMFLQGQKRVDADPQLLRRTISGPVQVLPPYHLPVYRGQKEFRTHTAYRRETSSRHYLHTSMSAEEPLQLGRTRLWQTKTFPE